MFYAFTREVLGSNFCRDTGCLEMFRHSFPQTLESNAAIIPRSGQEPFLLNFFFNASFQSLCHWKLYEFSF